MFPEGSIVIIANPAAQIGRGKAAAEIALDKLRAVAGAERVSLVLTEAPGHAAEIATNVDDGCSLVIGLGGDGLMHEVCNGLMRRPAGSRPAFGVLPVGSGNDYAATIGMSENLDQAVRQLAGYPILSTDVGCCNGEYFLETLSFGLDAAIAIGTEERRRRTGQTGNRLYLEEGLDQILRHRDTHPFVLDMEEGCRVRYSGKKVVMEGEPVSRVEGSMLLLAVQNGQTYGGGFLITPGSHLDDGVFDLCVANAPLGLLRAVSVFLKAKNGGHTEADFIDFYRARSIRVDFGKNVPAQVDGEKIEGSSFEVSMCPRALRVVRKA